MTHPTDEVLLDLYACLEAGDLDAFLAGCTDDATFSIPGKCDVSGTWNKASFKEVL
jgi:ketosteroid isomerase-like protein